MKTVSCIQTGPRRSLSGIALTGLLVFAATALGARAGSTSNAAPAALPAPTFGEIRGVHAVRGDRVIASEGADQRLTPASVQKLVVAAAMLHSLGPDYRWRTTVEAPALSSTGAVSMLLVVSSGDPSWNKYHFARDSRSPLRDLARQVYASGVRRVDGDVVVDATSVVGRRTSLGWSAGDANVGYGAAPSALAIDDNRSTVKIAPGRALGSPAKVTGEDGLSWRNDTVTVGPERFGRGTIEFDVDWGTASAVIRGEYPINEPPFTVEVATPNPTERAAWAFVQTLRENGVDVRGRVRVLGSALEVSGQRSTTSTTPIAVFASPPLREMLVPVLSESSNFAAEMLLRHLGLVAQGTGRLDAGLDAASAFLVKVVGLDAQSFVLDDGSGLSPLNLISPRGVVTLLRWSWNQPWRAEYFGAMTSDTEGTVAKFWPRAPSMRAKTGTLQQTQCLVGVLLPSAAASSISTRSSLDLSDPSDSLSAPGVSEPVFFAWMVNHSTRERRDIRAEVIKTLWQWSRAAFAAASP